MERGGAGREIIIIANKAWLGTNGAHSVFFYEEAS